MRVGMFVGRFAAIALLAAASAVGVAAADPYDDVLAKCRKRLVSRLQGVVDAARGKRISGFRHRVYRVILRFDPDHRRARRALGYKRTSTDDPWVQAGDYREPADWDQVKLAKAQEARNKVYVRYRDAVLAVMDGMEKPDEVRESQLLDELLELLPDDAVLHERRGEVLHEGEWLQPLSIASRRKLTEYKSLLGKVRKRVRPEIEKSEELLKKGWETAWKSKTRLVIGSVEPREARLALVGMEVADGFCSELFGPIKLGSWPEVALLLQSRDQARALLKSRPEWKRARDLIEKAGSIHLPDRQFLTFRLEPDHMRLSCIRQVVDWRLRIAYGKHARGWITEGIGQRITWYVTRKQGPGFASFTSTEEYRSGPRGGMRTLPRNPSDWTRAAAMVLGDEGGARRLGALLTRRLNAMEREDVLLAYGLAAYLFEARPTQMPAFVKATIQRHDAEAIVKETLGADDVAMLAAHLRRWLLEN